jgi:hypothetical protein
MKTAIVCSAAAVVVLLGAGCGSSDATSPAVTGAPAVVPIPITPPASPNFPEPVGPSRIFVFDHATSYAVSEYTKQSRFVLYDNQAVALIYDGLGLEYRGGYTEVNGNFVFNWGGGSSIGAWGARGALKADTLIVQYNLAMGLSDFEDAAYVISR